jgi:hypothetical protein
LRKRSMSPQFSPPRFPEGYTKKPLSVLSGNPDHLCYHQLFFLYPPAAGNTYRGNGSVAESEGCA